MASPPRCRGQDLGDSASPSVRPDPGLRSELAPPFRSDVWWGRRSRRRGRSPRIGRRWLRRIRGGTRNGDGCLPPAASRGRIARSRGAAPWCAPRRPATSRSSSGMGRRRCGGWRRPWTRRWQGRQRRRRRPGREGERRHGRHGRHGQGESACAGPSWRSRGRRSSCWGCSRRRGRSDGPRARRPSAWWCGAWHHRGRCHRAHGRRSRPVPSVSCHGADGCAAWHVGVRAVKPVRLGGSVPSPGAAAGGGAVQSRRGAMLHGDAQRDKRVAVRRERPVRGGQL